MKRNKCALVLVLIFGVVVCAEAKAIKNVFQEGAVDVHSQLGRVVEIVVGSGVSNIVRSGDPSSLKVEQVAGHLFITPLLRNAAELVVIDGNGRSYRLKFIFDQGMDEKILIAPPKDAGYVGKGVLSSVDLIRELALGRVPPGAVETAREKVVFQDLHVRLKMVLMYEMPDIVGYVLTAENLLPQSLVVPIEQFNFPGLLAVTAQKDILTPAGTTGSKSLVYMVASR